MTEQIRKTLTTEIDDIGKRLDVFLSETEEDLTRIANVPVLGVIENMAWFTPKELPDNKYYIFGRGGARAYAEQAGVPFLGDIPIIQSIMEGAESGEPSVAIDADVERYYREIAQKIIAAL